MILMQPSPIEPAPQEPPHAKPLGHVVTAAGTAVNDEIVADLRGKRCFVIMPYNTRTDADGHEHNFEEVFRQLIAPPLTQLGLRCERSKDTAEQGLIHKSMIDQILDWELAIVDITSANPNVFYELGIRHTARPYGTIIICHEGTKPPFNINGVRIIKYSIGADRLRIAQEAIRDAAIASLTHRSHDSLVHQIVPSLNLSRKSKVLQHRDIIQYELPSAVQAEHATHKNRRMGIITGDLVYVDNVDIWVNPENTRMEMARIHDDAVSATIRYHGGVRDTNGNLKHDIIGQELRRQRRTGTLAEATTVIVTRAGNLRRPNRVRRLFHLAAQHGEPGKGYVTVQSIPDCIKSAIEKADDINHSWRIPIALRLARPLQSIIFPLFGTRGRDVDAQLVTDALVSAAMSYLRSWPGTKINDVYFLAYTNRDLELCQTAFDRLGLKKLV